MIAAECPVLLHGQSMDKGVMLQLQLEDLQDRGKKVGGGGI